MGWQIINNLDYNHYMQKYNIDTLLAKTFAYKKLECSDIELICSNRLLYHDFSLFSEAEITLERIEEALENQEKICIYGDYDCDGILATTILVEAFRMRGVKVGYHIPNRSHDGYGLNVKRVEQMAAKGYTLIITVDNGIKANEAITRAHELGVDVIVTDHHDYEEQLPEAFSIIHTKISPDYPFKEISGGFVAYKLASALLNKHDKYLFCLAAITTISDMMPLINENRSLVKRALVFMQKNKYPQLELLLGKNQSYNVTSLGFTIAPKINSFGRLSEYVNPNYLVKYFMQDASLELINTISTKAIEINKKRQTMTTQQYQQVLKNTSSEERFLYSYETSVHEGLIGLVAGKYTREYQRPSFVMCYDEINDVYKGSARGVEGILLGDVFKEVEDVLEGYGGHALAGGFSVKKDNLETLYGALKQALYPRLSNYQPPLIDVIAVSSEEITKKAVKELELLEPLGSGNEAVSFYVADLPIKKVVLLSGGKHLRFDFVTEKTSGQALFFNQGQRYPEFKDLTTINVIGRFNLNVFNGIETVNLVIDEIK